MQLLDLAQIYLSPFTNKYHKHQPSQIQRRRSLPISSNLCHSYYLDILLISALGSNYAAAAMSFWKKHPPRAPPVIRIERVASKATSSTAATSSSNATAPRPSIQNRLAGSRSASNLSTRSNATSLKETYAPKSSPIKKSRKRSPAYQRIESDSSDDDTDDTAAFAKRQRISSHELEDPDRRLRARKPFSEADSKALIHAADIASLKHGFKPCFGKAENVGVSLHYPGSSIKERLVGPGSWIGLLDN